MQTFEHDSNGRFVVGSGVTVQARHYRGLTVETGLLLKGKLPYPAHRKARRS